MIPVATVLTRGRAHAARLMTDTCVITRVTATAIASNGDTTPTTTEVYTGACRVRPRQTQDRMVEQGGAEVGVGDLVVSLPITAIGVAPGDVVTITASTYDETLVDRSMTVLGVLQGSQVTARRLSCQEVS